MFRSWKSCLPPIALALAAALGFSAPARVDAGTSQPPSAASAACPLPGGRPAGTLPKPLDSADLAQQLATALNLPLATVQQALTKVGSQMSSSIPQPNDPIAGAATQLGVSEQQLVTAVQSADQTLAPAVGIDVGQPVFAAGGGQTSGPVLFSAGGPTGTLPPGGGGNLMFTANCSGGGTGRTLVDPTMFFADVAQQLGSNFTGPQVQAAFQASAPTPPAPGTVQSLLQQESSGLASALGISVNALTSALNSIGYPSGCVPLLGLSETAKPQVPIGGASAGPIFIPLGNAGGRNAIQIADGPLAGSGQVAVAAGGIGGAGIACAIGGGPAGDLSSSGS